MSRTLLRALIACLLCTASPSAVFAAEGGLVLTPQPDLLIALLVFFLLLVVPVHKVLFAPLLRVLDEREEKIAGTRARAEKLERNASETLARYQSSVRQTRDEAELERRATLEEVRREAQRETAAARSEAEGRIEAARTEVDTALESARGGLRAQAEELARQAASQVLGRAL